MTRALILALLCGSPALAQFAFSVVENSLETPVVMQVQLPAAACGDTLATRFRVRNTGNATASLTTLTLAGSAFSPADLPLLPVNLLPGSWVDFTVRFQPSTPGNFSALLKADGASVFVLASAAPVLAVSVLENGMRRQLNTGSAVDLGTVERGLPAVRRFLLENQTEQRLVAALGVAGAAYRLAGGTPAAVALDPLESTAVEVVVTPLTAGPQPGELRIDQRRFPLTAGTVEPALPKPLILLDMQDREAASAMQPGASVRFDPAPRTSGTGRLRIEFRPAVAALPALAALDDPAILFLATGSRTIDFSAIEGEPGAQFGPAVTAPWQTGTTAGTILFTAELGTYVETASIEIPPRAVVIDSVVLSRDATAIAIRVSGFDNTRSLATARFTFLRKDGSVIPPGTIEQNLGAAFQEYFAHSEAGGTFEMKAAFPMAGGTDSVDQVRVEITNQVGTTTWP